MLSLQQLERLAKDGPEAMRRPAALAVWKIDGRNDIAIPLFKAALKDGPYFEIISWHDPGGNRTVEGIQPQMSPDKPGLNKNVEAKMRGIEPPSVRGGHAPSSTRAHRGTTLA